MDNSISLREKSSPSHQAGGGMSVVPLGGLIGAQVLGVDIAAGVDDAAFAFVRDALHQHSVIVLRDQHITPRQQTDFSARLGELRTSFYNRYAVGDRPELSIVSNIVKDGQAIGIADAGMLWHTDASYLAQPDMYTLLYGVDIPSKDGKVLGDTMFSSAWSAYDALPDALKKKLLGLKAVHSFVHHIEKKRTKGQLKRAELTAEQKAALPDVQHPVVRRHPINGRLCLFVTEGHTKEIVGLPAQESSELLEMLFQHLARPEFVYRHSWRPGDLVIWDNCALQHLAMFDYGDIPRKLHRAGVMGPVPV